MAESPSSKHSFQFQINGSKNNHMRGQN
jgi:hypothetical protein